MTPIEIKEIRIKLYGDNRESFGKWTRALGYHDSSHLRKFELSEDHPDFERPSHITVNLIKVLVKIREMNL